MPDRKNVFFSNNLVEKIKCDVEGASGNTHAESNNEFSGLIVIKEF